MSNALLAKLPAIHVLADEAVALGDVPRWAAVEAARRAVAARREAILRGGSDPAIAATEVARLAVELARPPLRRVINATGVVLHTNLGRAPLAAAARRAVDDVARGYSNLEYDVARGERGSRHDHLRGLLRDLTGAEDAIVANNNAAATVLGLAALAAGKEIVVSRGELIEIGGSFRLPEILALSRGTLVEVGTTNKTHRRDYEAAIGPATGLLLKVHRSNFAIVGFTAEVTADELVAIGRARGVPTMVDLGSGALIDRATQRQWGLPDEPTVAETVASGADLVTFSGDKLLGAPQAGILVGRHAAVETARKHPLMRAVRPDKMTLAGLAATLALYRDGRTSEIPAVAMLSRPADELRAIAERLVSRIRGGDARGNGDASGRDDAGGNNAASGRDDAGGNAASRPANAGARLAIIVEPCASAVGGGAMPTAKLASFAVTLRGRSPDELDRALRAGPIAIVGRIEEDRLWLDVRTIAADELDEVAAAVRRLG